MTKERAWQVPLVGGASGVGILEGMTTPEQYPELHGFCTRRDEWDGMGEEQRLAFAIRYATVMSRALELGIASHLEGQIPIVLGGDFPLPSLAAQPSCEGIPASGQVRSPFVYEDDEDQIGRHDRARDGEWQPERARASWRPSQWLRQEAERLGVPAIAALPWDTIFERACAILDRASIDSPRRAGPAGQRAREEGRCRR